MATSAVQNAQAKASKKRTKAGERTDSPAPPVSPAPEKESAGEDGQENAYIRELQKNIRNINKKITNASKTDSLIAEHPGKNLDQLVAAKVINADQKAQILKKPALQAQLAQAEEQLAQYKKLDAEYRARAADEKANVEKALVERLEKEKEDAVREAKEQAEADHKTAQHDNFLVISQFLRLAAARRAEDADQTVDENLALEGVLLAVYSGDEGAVSTMTKLIEGSGEHTMSTSGDTLRATFADIKAASQAYKPPYYGGDEGEAKIAASDATITNAGPAEVATGETVLPNGHAAGQSEGTGRPPNTDVGNDAANPAAESQWDTANDLSMSMSQEWVSVPRDPAETETGLEATPAAPANTQSWADEQPENPPEAQADPNDGFHQVQRSRGRDTNFRGRGNRGNWRGRGYKGDGRGRRGEHRGEHRGGNAAARGPRRAEES